MKARFWVVFLSVAAIGFVSSNGFSQQDTKAAEQAGNAWLVLIDAEKYPYAWKGFSTFFTTQMTFPKWEAQIKSARGIFGKFESRKLKSATPATSLPGAPDGQYVVLQYDTSFEKKKSALETLTVSLDKGKWGVVGYFIK